MRWAGPTLLSLHCLLCKPCRGGSGLFSLAINDLKASPAGQVIGAAVGMSPCSQGLPAFVAQAAL